MKIIGSFVSPYVRKVLACMNLKGLAYEVDPITPFFGNDEFERLSPLRRIPVLVDGDFTISNSSVICAYLDEAYPGHPLFPPTRRTARARAGSRNLPTPGSATCSSGASSTRRSFGRWCGASRPTRRGSPSAQRGHPRGARLSRGRAAGRRLPLRRHRRRRHRDRQLLPQRRLCGLRDRRRRAGRGPPPSSSARSPIPRSPRCCRSRTSSAAPRSSAGARHCSMRERR